jgi:hypothetical protein
LSWGRLECTIRSSRKEQIVNAETHRKELTEKFSQWKKKKCRY